MKPLAHATNPLNIFLVEDDDGEAKAITRAFRDERIGNPIVRAIDGVEALELLRGQEIDLKLPEPFVMLVDLNMPRMGGIELIREIRKDPGLRQTIIFVLTTSDNENDIAAAYDAQISGYVRKAHAGRDFEGLIDLLGDYWKVIEMPARKRTIA